MQTNTAPTKFAMKDYKAADPRWCTGCGDYTILVGLRKFMVNNQLSPSSTVNVSGIGCSGRIPHYMNTYGLHSIHGRAIPIATGISLARPDLNLFIESGDGDALSIGGNHLIHGINKNFNCVFALFDNQIYGLTKNQTSPTTQRGHKTQSQPEGSWINPINPLRFALGLGATFVASTAEWLGQHMVDTLEQAFQHKGFSFVHIAQRCPKFNPGAWDHEKSDWITFIQHDSAVAADLKSAPDAKVETHDPADLAQAFHYAQMAPDCFGIFYRGEKPRYDALLQQGTAKAPQKDRAALLDSFLI
ncbi:MAG: thiamine pyrophosphate-dependent enzyme [Candidatus Margulisiibacteriota bacterium]